MSSVGGRWKECPYKRNLLFCPGLSGVLGSLIGAETAFRYTCLQPSFPLCSHWRREGKAGRRDDGRDQESDRAENQPLVEFLSKISNNSLDPIIRGQGRGPDFFQGLPARAHRGILRKGGEDCAGRRWHGRSPHPTGPEPDKRVHVSLSIRYYSLGLEAGNPS